MKKILFVFLCSLSFVLVAQAQNAPKPPEYWLVQHVFVKPNANDAYEANVKKLVMAIAHNTGACPPFTWYTFASDERNMYTYVIPVTDFDNLEDIYDAMGDEVKAFPQLHGLISDEVESYDISLMEVVPKLSYKNPHTSNNNPFNVVETIEVVPGREAEFEQAIANWIHSAHGAKGASWTVFTTLIGSDLPLYTLVYNGPSMEDFHAQIMQLAGKNWRKLMLSRKGGIVREHRTISNVYVKSLSSLGQTTSKRP